MQKQVVTNTLYFNSDHNNYCGQKLAVHSIEIKKRLKS